MKKNRLNKTVAVVAVGFIPAALLVAANEVFDLPHLIFNAPPTSIN
jgi:hypothetical protein